MVKSWTETITKIAMNALIGFSCCATAGASTCDLSVVDEAQVFDSVKVASAVDRLKAHGADVRVRSVSRIDTATLDDYMFRESKTCDSWWTITPGENRIMKNNLVVLMVAVGNRKSGLWYGQQWGYELQAIWPQIEGQDMNPRFKKGDFTGGIVAALDHIGSAITSAERVYSDAPIKPHTEDHFGLWLLGGIPVLYGVALLLALRHKKRRDLDSARQEFINAQGDAASAVTWWSSGTGAFDALSHAEARALADSAIERFSRIVDPGTRGTELHFLNCACGYRRVVSDIKEAHQMVVQGTERPEAKSIPLPVLPPVGGRLGNWVSVKSSGSRTTNNVLIPIIESSTVIVPDVSPSPDRGSGRGGGSTDYSSDSGGGSSDFSSSDSGGGGSSDW